MDPRARLRFVADAYLAGLRGGDVSALPYHERVQFRTPLATAGSDVPLEGKAALLDYFSNIYSVVEEIRVVDYFFNDSLTSVCVRFDLVLKMGKVLRIADILQLNADGEVVELENHYDPQPALE
jgi:hypothetical protein